MKLYAMSDIHGRLDVLKNIVKSVDLENRENKLIFIRRLSRSN